MEDQSGVVGESSEIVEAPDTVSETQQPEAESTVPPELRPDANGKPPEITPKLLRTLRGKYFTVRHQKLSNCGHRFDSITEPRTNCENCWWTFFNTHRQLVEIADQMYKVHGKAAIVGLRGEKFFKMFLRFMSTVARLLAEQELVNEDKKRGDTGASGEEIPSTVVTADEGGETQGSDISVGLTQ